MSHTHCFSALHFGVQMLIHTGCDLVPLVAAVPFAFVVLKDDSLDHSVVIKELRSLVATKIAKYAVPDDFLVSP